MCIRDSNNGVRKESVRREPNSRVVRRLDKVFTANKILHCPCRAIPRSEVHVLWFILYGTDR
eukprot:2008828-Pyramimonas_sp.AAC.1